MNQELMLRASLIERQAEELNQSLTYIAQQIADLEEFKENLKVFSKSGQNEMLSAIGRGVYAKTSLKNKDLFVSVGAGVIIKKTPEQTQETIDQQVKNLHEAKIQLMGQLEICNKAIRETLAELESQKK